MQVLLAILLSLLLSSGIPVRSAGLSVDSGQFAMSSEEYSVSFSNGRVSIDGKYFSAGDIGRFGLLRTVSDPYSSAFSLRPDASIHQNNGRQSGIIGGVDAFKVGFSLDGRPLAFAYAGSEYAEGAVVFAFPGYRAEESYLIPETLPADASVLYMAVSGGWKFFRAAGIASFSPEKGFELFGALGMYWGRYSLFVLGGDAIPLYERGSMRSWGLRFSIGESGFRSDFSLFFGTDPVFTSSFRPVKASIRSELEVHGIRVYSSMEYSFSPRGSVYKRDRIVFNFMGFSAGYDTSGGPVLAYSHDIFEIGYEDGAVYAEIRLPMSGQREAELRLSSDGSVDIALSIAL